MTATDQRDVAADDGMRIFIYSYIVDAGAPPSSAQIATQLGISHESARDAVRALGAAKQVVLDAQTGEIWMAGPFSAVPTRFRVHGATASWWANCAWDMLGIPASIHQSVRVDAACADCEEEITLEVDADRGVVSGNGLVHILVPARAWYDDIGFT